MPSLYRYSFILKLSARPLYRLSLSTALQYVVFLKRKIVAYKGRNMIIQLIRDYKEGHIFFGSFLLGDKRNEQPMMIT